MFYHCLLVPQKRLLPLTSMGPRELGVSIAPKYRIYPLPSTGSEDVTYTESRSLTPRPLDTQSQCRGVGLGVRSTLVRLTCARSLRPNCRKLHHAQGNISTTIHYKIIHGCVRTARCLHRGHTMQHKSSILDPMAVSTPQGAFIAAISRTFLITAMTTHDRPNSKKKMSRFKASNLTNSLSRLFPCQTLKSASS